MDPAALFPERWPRGRDSIATRCLVFAGVLSALAFIGLLVTQFLASPKSSVQFFVAEAVAIAVLVVSVFAAFWIERRAVKRGLTEALKGAGWRTGGELLPLLSPEAREAFCASRASEGPARDVCSGTGKIDDRRVYVWVSMVNWGNWRHTRVGVLCELRSPVPPFVLATPLTLRQQLALLTGPGVGADVEHVAANWRASRADAQALTSHLSPEALRFLEWSPRAACMEVLPPFLVVHQVLQTNRDAEPDRVQRFIERSVMAAAVLEHDPARERPMKNPDADVGAL